MRLVNQRGRGRVWALSVDAIAAPQCLRARMASLNPSCDGFRWHTEVSTQMPTSCGGELLAAAYVDDHNVGLNSLLVVTRPSAGSIAISCVELSEDNVFVEYHNTHALPSPWRSAAIVVEIMNGPHTWLTCPMQSESQLLLVRSDDVSVLYASVPQPHEFQSACLIANAAVDPTSSPSTQDMHILVHSTEGTTQHWHTLPLPRPSTRHEHLHKSSRSTASQPYVPPPPKRYLPSDLSISCVWIDQEGLSSLTHRMLLGTTAPSLVASVHDCIVATLTLPGIPMNIQHAHVHGLDDDDSGAHGAPSPPPRSDVFVVSCINHAVVVVLASPSTLSIVQEFSNAWGVFVNDFKSIGWDQVLFVPPNPVDEQRWALADAASVLQSAAPDAVKSQRTKKTRRKTAQHVDHDSIQVLMNKLAEPAQADKLATIQAALGIRAKEAHDALVVQHTMLGEKQAMLAMLERQCRHMWLDQINGHVVAGSQPGDDGLAGRASLKPLQPLIPPLDDIETAPAPALPILVHPMVLESIVPSTIQHSPVASTLHFVATVRNASSAPLEQVTVLLVSSNMDAMGTGGSGVAPVVAAHATHAFQCHVALPSDLHRHAHVEWHVLAAWGRDQACLLFDQDPIRVNVKDILKLPVHAPNLGKFQLGPSELLYALVVLDSCELLLLTTTCQLDQWLPPRATELGLDIASIKPGLAKVKVAAPNPAMLECQLRHIQRELQRHDIFVLENPLHPTHLGLIQAALSAMQAEVAFEAALPAPDRRGSVQMELDRAIGELHIAMHRRANRRHDPSNAPDQPN